MEKHKRISELKEQLATFEQDVLDSITYELGRIDRTASMNELHYDLFTDAVAGHLIAIRLDEDGEPIFDADFGDIREKHLASIISDCEMGHWDMIGLLELLMDIETN